MKLFFHSPKKLENLAAILRTLEVFGIREIYVFDSYNLLQEEYRKVYKRKLNKISAGSYQYMSFHKVNEPLEFIKKYPNRTIASVIKDETHSLLDFQFQTEDILIMGNETLGLPNQIITDCKVKLKIPQIGKTESLNLGIATSILVYENFRQKQKNKNL